MKTCTKCGLEQEESAYSWKIKNVQRSATCKSCHKKYRRQHYVDNREKYIAKARAWEISRGGKRSVIYNLSPEEIADLVARYDGFCWICRIKEAVHIDHDHTCCSGATSCGVCVRGVLCSGCNTGLGRLGDSIEGLGRAIQYLKDSQK